MTRTLHIKVYIEEFVAGSNEFSLLLSEIAQDFGTGMQPDPYEPTNYRRKKIDGTEITEARAWFEDPDFEPTTISGWLTKGGYDTVEEWMLDSDYHLDINGDWRDDEGFGVDPIGCIEGAMEAQAEAEAHQIEGTIDHFDHIAGDR
jgi:hypothetical protein